MQRVAWPDIAKGIAIVLVVYGHAVRGLFAPDLGPEGGWAWADYLVYSVHMPVFFAISGYFFDASIDKGRRQFGRDRLKTIVWPYFLWSALHFVAQLLGHRLHLTNFSVEPERILSILWDPISPFWFLYALGVAMLVSALIRPFNPLGLAGISGAILLLLGFLDHPQLIDDIFYALFYFSLGRSLRRIDLSFLNATPIQVLVAVAFVLFVTVGYLAGVPVRLNYFAGISGLALFYGLSRTLSLHPAVARSLTPLGLYSMGIFVMHVTVLAATRALGLRIFDNSMPPTIILIVVLGVVLPMLVQRLANGLGVAGFLGLNVGSPPGKASSGKPTEQSGSGQPTGTVL